MARRGAVRRGAVPFGAAPPAANPTRSGASASIPRVTPTETLPGPDLDSWRNRLAHRIANLALNRIATADYRDIIGGAILLGMRTALDSMRARLGDELWHPLVERYKHVDPDGPFGI
jgi:hypothetical protein